MKKNYFLNFKSKVAFGVFAFTLIAAGVNAQQSFTFTPAGATGSLGPTQTQVNTAYQSTSLNNSVVVNPAGIQNFTVPITGGYRIDIMGAKGYGTNGGRGACMAGDFTLTAGTVLKIVVGQQGQPPISPGTNQYGGGGGSFVTYTNNTPLVVAGGGGGSWAQTLTGASDGTTSTSGNAAQNGPTNGTGGTNGSGGGTAGSADGGGGLTGNGGGTNGGLAFINGATGGGAQYAHGGFGGGGGASSWDNRRGGGGGGYSGGGGAGSTTTGFPEGGGGGSINNGTNQTNTSGCNNGDGRVVITELCSVKIISSSSGTNSPTYLCSGNSLTLTTDAVSGYSWSTGQTTNSIVVAPTTNTIYSVSGTSSLNCQATGYMSVTVSSGLPVLSISNPSNNICLGKTVSLTATGALTYSWSAGVVNGQTFTPTSTQNYTVTGGNGCGTVSAITTITVAPIQISVLASPSLVCQGYTSTLTAVSPVTGYTWFPTSAQGATTTVAPMANTIYTVAASDGTCSGTQTIMVTTKTTPTITASASSSMICEGQSSNLSATGASTYSWSPGGQTTSNISVSPTTSSLYVVYGTNSLGCTASANQVVVVNPSPTITVAADKPTVCADTPVTFTASGASSYTWTNGPQSAINTVTPSGPGVYTVSGINSSNNCVGSKTVSINVIVPSVTLSPASAICAGGSVTLTAAGANTYTWSNGGQGPNTVVQPTASTLYTVTAKTTTQSVNCFTSHSVQITVNPNPIITVAATRSIICKNESTTLTASGASSYSWGAAGSGSTIVVKPLVTTMYTVTGTNVNNCSSQFLFTALVLSCNSIAENGKGSQVINVYPNPSSGEFFIETSSAIDLQIINNLGQLIKEISLDEHNKNSVRVTDLAAGVYFIVGENDNGKVNQKLVINK